MLCQDHGITAGTFKQLFQASMTLVQAEHGWPGDRAAECPEQGAVPGQLLCLHNLSTATV